MIVSLILLVSLAACQTSTPSFTALPPTAAALAATLPPVTAVPTTAALVASTTPTLPATPTPTATLTPTPTRTPMATRTPTPSRTPTATLIVIATNTPRPTNTPTRTPPATMTFTTTPTASLTLTPTAASTRGATLTPPPAGAAATLADHYYLARALSDNAINYAARTYPYGGTAGGRLQVHLGQDFENPTGTPVLAAGDGTVVHAGDDLTTLLGPYNNYYGNVVVIQHTFSDSSGGPVYTLYGHLSRVSVTAGQTVKRGDIIGNVGATGIAQGPHLHLEVRVGNAFDYRATRNPDLWVFPYFGFGTLAGRVTDAAGNRLNDVTLTILSETATRYTFSYFDNTVNSDSTFGENWTLGDLPEGYYTVRVSENGRVRFEQETYVYPGKTTWVDVVLSP
jgi:murein DD-endopeptidase MepM/ murein hydrolase activator NlpD